MFFWSLLIKLCSHISIEYKKRMLKLINMLEKVKIQIYTLEVNHEVYYLSKLKYSYRFKPK